MNEEPSTDFKSRCPISFGKVHQAFSLCDTLQREDRNSVMSPGYLRCRGSSA